MAFAQPTCGEPDYDRSVDAAAFLYYDCGTSDWHLRVTGGGSRHVYQGTISSPQFFESLAEFSLEGSDSLQPPAFGTPTPGPIEFALIVGGSGQDGLDFGLAAGATACFVLDSPNVPLILGADRETAAGNTVELGGAFGPCAPDGGFVLSAADLTVPEGDGLSSAQFTVNLSPAPPPGVTVYVDYQTVDGTATAGPDYVMSSGTLMFDAGVAQQLLSIDLIGDTVPEGDEYFELSLSSANTNSITATATITNDDGALPPVCGTPDVNSFRNNDNAVLLYWDCGTDDWHLRVTSSGESLDYLATLSSNLLILSMETFSYESSDTLQPAPFIGPPGTAGPFVASMGVANAGQDGLDFRLSPGSNSCLEFSASMSAMLYVGADAIGQTGNSVQLGNDFAQCSGAPLFTLAVSNLDVPEGDVGSTSASFVLNVSPVPGTGESLSVDYETVDGSALAGSDYVAAVGTVVFGNGVGQQIVDVEILSDTDPEGDEVFDLVLTSPASNPVIARATIQNDDGIPPPACGEPAYDRATETAVFVYNDCTTRDWHIRVTAGGQGTAYAGSITSGQPFEALGVFSFETSDSLEPPPFDTPTAGPIAFLMNVGGAGQDGLDVRLSEGALACLSITEPGGIPVFAGADRVPVGSEVSLPSFAACPTYDVLISGLTVDESIGSADFTLTLSPAPAVGQQVVLSYATEDGAAESGFDYEATSGSVTFAAGETQKSVAVAIIDDIDPEPSEDFRLQVTVPAVGTVSATATIIDDDSVPPVLLPLKPLRTRFYAPNDLVSLAIQASEPDGTDITDLVTWFDDSGFQIGNGGILAVQADAIWNTRGQHHVTARVVEQSSGLGLDAMLEFPVVMEDVVVYGADSILDGFDERVVIPSMSRGDIAVVLQPYATLPASGGEAARMNSVVTSPDGGLWVNDMRGYLYDISVIGDSADPLAPVPYLDLAAAIGPAFRFSHNQQGFSYVAFHPDFPTNGRFYTVHSETIGAIPADFPLDRETDKAGNPVVASHHEVVTEWTADDPSAAVFSGTHREVLRIEEPYADHNVGQIAFDNSLDPTDAAYGFLFIPVGDGGRPGQGEYTAALDEGQDPTTVLGSILRVIPEPDPLSGKGYRIPADNPFVADSAVLDEIWAYGLRNPHRLTFDAETGRMLISDIGEANVEEINIGQAGANYGWSIREGTFAHPDDAIRRAGGGIFDRAAHRSYVSPLPSTDLSSTTYPAIQYDHNESLQGSRGRAIADAHIYRGSLPLLQGKLIFGDFPDGRLFTAGTAGLANGSPGQIDEIGMYVDEDGDGVDDLVLDLRATVDVDGSRADIRIGVDAYGELYLTNKKNGTIYRVADAVATDLGDPATLPPYVPPIDFLTTGYINVLDYAGVDRTGLTVSTQGIQQAIDDALAQDRVVVFPPGTYLVDDTIRCMQPASDPQANSDHDVGCTLIGDTSGARPLIKLVDNSPLFGDPSIPQATVSGGVVTEWPTVRPVIHFWRQQRMDDGGSTDPELEDGARSYNNIVRNIDIDVGHANPGAIGIRLLGAEGSAIQEVKVLARNGFAGLYSFPSNGGLPTNIEIVGGRYGIYAPTVRGGAHTIAGLRMSGQTDQPIVYTDRFPLTIVGFEIVHDDGPVLTPRLSGADSSGHVALIDGTIEINGGSGPAIENTDRAVYLQNVYFKGSATVVSNLTDGDTLAAVSPAGWTQVVEYDYLSGASYIDSLVNGAPLSSGIETLAAVEAPPTDLIERHVYPAGLCSFHDPAMIDVRDFGAAGDGLTDDTIALQTAIDAGDAVLLPKGEYLVSGTLNLGSNTRLCGVATPLSAIVADPNWAEATSTPLLRTPDDAAASVVLDSFDVRTWDTANRIFHIDWRAGRNSIIKNITGTANGPYPGSFDVPLVRMRISGNGGGRVYGYVQEIGRDCMDPGCRLLLIQGTREPLDFYQYHSQYLRVGGGPLTELSDAQNVRFFGHKSETIIPGGEQQHASRFGTPWPILMTIEDSSHIELFGEEGSSQAEPGRGLFEIRNSTDVTLTNVARRGNNNAYYDEQTWFFVKEEFGGATYSVDATGVLGLFRRD